MGCAAVFWWVSDPYAPTVYPVRLARLWNHTQDASLGQGVRGVSGKCSTVLFTSTCRGGLGKRRALRAILYILVVFFFSYLGDRLAQVSFGTTVEC